MVRTKQTIKASNRRNAKADAAKPGETPRKPAHPGRWVPNEMIKLQRETGTQIPRAVVLRIIKEFSEKLENSERMKGTRWQKMAIDILHAVGEAFLEETLEDANDAALCRKVVSPLSRDINLALKLRWARRSTPCSNLWHDYKDWFKKHHKLTEDDIERYRNRVLARQRAKAKAKAAAGKKGGTQ